LSPKAVLIPIVVATAIAVAACGGSSHSTSHASEPKTTTATGTGAPIVAVDQGTTTLTPTNSYMMAFTISANAGLARLIVKTTPSNQRVNLSVTYGGTSYLFGVTTPASVPFLANQSTDTSVIVMSGIPTDSSATSLGLWLGVTTKRDDTTAVPPCATSTTVGTPCPGSSASTTTRSSANPTSSSSTSSSATPAPTPKPKANYNDMSQLENALAAKYGNAPWSCVVVYGYHEAECVGNDGTQKQITISADGSSWSG